MRLIAKTKIVSAILSVAFLLFNPAGICAGRAKIRGASVLSKAGLSATTRLDNVGLGVHRPPFAPSVPFPAGEGQLFHPRRPLHCFRPQTPDRVLPLCEFVVFSPEDRFLQLGQLLPQLETSLLHLWDA